MTRFNPIRSLTLALIAALVFTACASDAGPTLTAPQALEQSRSGAVTLIDIRTPPEWRQTGVPAGALRIDMKSRAFVNDILTAVDGDKSAPIAIICRTGNRTTYTQKALSEMGFTRVYNVKEGMAGSGAGPGWLKRGLPVESCGKC